MIEGAVMNITEIQIERYGVWRNVSLAVPSAGLNVVYGPNEAGKTTLMRFIRSVLYGYGRQEPASSAARGDVIQDGSLVINADGASCRIRRVSRVGTRGLVSVMGLSREEPAEQLLAELLKNTDERLFEHVFAFGLQDLQELATLPDEQVAGRIYGLTLLPEGRKLLDVTKWAEADEFRLFNPNSEDGELADLLTRDDELSHALVQLDVQQETYRESCVQRTQARR